MANNNISTDDSSKGESPGRLLSDGRKKAKLSEREVADALKISVSRLKSIESDDFSVFPSETYTRGHLRNYGRLLKIDEQQVLAAYDYANPASERNDAADFRPPPSLEDDANKPWWIVYVILVLLALAWALSYWVLGAKEEPFPSPVFDNIEEQASPAGVPELNDQRPFSVGESTASIQGDAVQEVDGINVATEPRGVASLSGSENAIGSDGSGGNSSAGEATGQPFVVNQLTASELVKSIQAAEQEQVPEIEKRIEGDTLQFVFAKASWIQVTDATGAVLFKGLNKPQAELALNGKAPFRIVIGNVDGTSLVYNGELVNLEPPEGKNTLRLTLGG